MRHLVLLDEVVVKAAVEAASVMCFFSADRFNGLLTRFQIRSFSMCQAELGKNEQPFCLDYRVWSREPS
jgi:hypothetical protein